MKSNLPSDKKIHNNNDTRLKDRKRMIKPSQRQNSVDQRRMTKFGLLK